MKLISPPIPIFRIFDVDKAREFFVDFLGFSVDWEHRFGDDSPVYMQISRNGLALHLSEHHGDCSPGSAVFVPVSDIDDFHRELSEKDYKYAKPGIEDAPWNARTVSVTDPFGNRLCFSQPNAEPT